MGWARRLRLLAEVLALTFLTVSCVASNPVVGPATPGASLSGPGAATSGQQSPPPSGGRTNVGSQPRAGTTVPGSLPAPVYDDDGPVGAMARTYLRSSPARSLTVEVDWVSGRDPSSQALDHLESILRRELNKPDGLAVRLGNRITSSRSSWSLADLVALERANRAGRSTGGRATMWIVYVGGSYAGNANALAVSFEASAAAIFRDRINDAASALVMAPEIERSVVLHEAGHLLALVNIGYQSRFDHEDQSHPNHSNDPNSVMYWAVEDISVRNLLRGGPPDDFDDADRADLAMLRAA